MTEARTTDEVVTNAGMLGLLPEHIVEEYMLPVLMVPLTHGMVRKPEGARDIISVASTCSWLHYAVCRPSLWRDVDACGAFIGRFGSLMKKRAADGCSSPPVLPLGAANCGVYRLSVNSNIDDAVAILEQLRDVSDLTISLIVSNDSFRDRIVRRICSMPRLTHLYLGDSGVIRGLAASSVALQSLRLLAVNDLQVGDDSFVPIFASGALPSLEELTIGAWIELTAEFAGAIAASCPSLAVASFEEPVAPGFFVALVTQLKSLRRLRCRVNGDVAVEMFCRSSLPRFPCMAELTIAFGGRGSRGVLAIFPNLETLEVSLCPTECLEDIAGLLHLHHLSVYYEGVASSIVPLAKAVEQSTEASSRRPLNSASFYMVDGGIGELLATPWCSRLRSLELRQCDVSSFSAAISANALSLSQTLSLILVEGRVLSASFGRFVGCMASLRYVLIAAHEFTGTSFDEFVSDFRGSNSTARPIVVRLGFIGSKEIDISAMAPLFGGADDAMLKGRFTESSIDAVRSVCPKLRVVE